MANDNSVVVKVGDKVFIKGDQGYVFIPNVSETGEISWTNDGGLPNPTTRNIMGPEGEKGDTPNFSIGTVTTGDPGSPAAASITGTPENPVLNLTIPKGDTGEVTQAEFDELADEVSRQKSALEEVTEEINHCQFESATVKGVTVTDNGDGTLTFNGTATGLVPLTSFELPAGTYLGYVVPVSGSATVQVGLRYNNGTDTSWVTSNQTSPKEVTFSENTPVYIRGNNGTYTNFTVRFTILDTAQKTTAIDVFAREDIESLRTETDGTKAIVNKNLNTEALLSDAWKSNLDSALARIDTARNAMSKTARSLHFTFFTDFHYEQNDKDLDPILDYVLNNSDCAFAVFGGDAFTHPAEGTRESGIERLLQFRDTFPSTWGRTNIIVGNHDWSTLLPYSDYGGTPPDHILSMPIIARTWLYKEGLPVSPTLQPTGAWYYDDTINNVRIIFGPTEVSSSWANEQVRWLISVLNDTPADYDVLVLCHRFFGINGSKALEPYIHDTETPFTPNGLKTGKMALIAAILSAFNSHGTISYQGTTYDFSQKTGAIIAVINGHVHMDAYAWFSYDDQTGVVYATEYTQGYIPAIAITCDSHWSQTIYGSNRKPLTQSEYNESDVINRYDYPAGSIERHAFDDILIDLDARHIYFTRIGSGDDLDIQY